MGNLLVLAVSKNTAWQSSMEFSWPQCKGVKNMVKQCKRSQNIYNLTVRCLFALWDDDKKAIHFLQNRLLWWVVSSLKQDMSMCDKRPTKKYSFGPMHSHAHTISLPPAEAPTGTGPSETVTGTNSRPSLHQALPGMAFSKPSRRSLLAQLAHLALFQPHVLPSSASCFQWCEAGKNRHWRSRDPRDRSRSGGKAGLLPWELQDPRMCWSRTPNEGPW